MRRMILLLVAFLPFTVMAQDEAEPMEMIYQKKAFELFNQVTADDPDNICFSPLSVQMVMSMVQNGAAGNTLSQMQDALGTTGYSNDEVNAYNRKVEEAITYRPPFNYNPNSWDSEEQQRKKYETAYPVCEMANGIWTRPGTSWYEQFIQIMQDCYKAGFGSVDFTTQEGIDVINRWISDKTHGMLPNVFDQPLSPDLAMLLANTLYFKGSWNTPFDLNETKLDTFHNADGIDVVTYMMRVLAYYHIVKTEKFLSLQIPYGRGDFSMTIFLPTEGINLPELTYDEWMRSLTETGDVTYTDLRMPSFDVKDSYDLNEVLKRMGMVDAFEPMLADFSNMRDDPLWISKVFQCSKINVNEMGTEAAAVTVVEVYGGMPSDKPEDFIIDRPFYFTIENRKTGTVLFVGRITQLQDMTISQDNTHICQQPSSSDIFNQAVYNIYGVKVADDADLLEHLSPGVYIVNGKKYVVR